MLVKKNWLKVLSLVGFVQMVLINSLANILPINNKTTGDISDQLQNLFTPEGSTFAIWGLIYFLLFIFIIRILIRPLNKKVKELIKLFIINSILNSSWIFAWHYEYLVISLFVMLGILINLIQINQLLKNTRNWEDKITLKLPFTVYFGWISIASIANVTALLVSYKWNGLGISEELWTVVILIFGVFIALTQIIYFRQIAYTFVIIWAYFGIYRKHISLEEFNSGYPQIIVVLVSCLVLLSLASLGLVLSNYKKRYF